MIKNLHITSNYFMINDLIKKYGNREHLDWDPDDESDMTNESNFPNTTLEIPEPEDLWIKSLKKQERS